MTTPTLKEELDRKSVESLQWLMSQHESGDITPREYVVALDTFNMITLGLIDKAISNAVTQESATVRRSGEYADEQRNKEANPLAGQFG